MRARVCAVVCCSLIDAELRMSLKTVHLRSLSQLNPPDCFQFDLQVNILHINVSTTYELDPVTAVLIWIHCLLES